MLITSNTYMYSIYSLCQSIVWLFLNCLIKPTSFLSLYFLVANSKHRASTCFCRYTISISSCRLRSFWASRARAKALLLVFRETLKKEDVSGVVREEESQHWFLMGE